MFLNTPGFSLDEIVLRLGGQVLGDGTTRVLQVASLSSAASGDLAFLANPRLKKELATTRASAAIISRRISDQVVEGPGHYILADDPYLYFARVAQLLNPVRCPPSGIHPSACVESPIPENASVGPGAWVGPGVQLGEGVIIGPGCRVGAGASLGDGALLHGGVTVYQDCHVGKRAVIHSGAVIGADGFGFAREKDGRWVKIPQIGRVLIGDDVEIGANTTIDRGALDDTVIADGVIIDNLVQVAHNVRIGRFTAIAGCVGIAGSTRIGERCMLGGAAMIIGHLEICDDVTVSAGTMISKSVREPGVYTGNMPQQAHADWLKNFAHVRHLEEMADRIRVLEKRLAELGDTN
ncbi:MAG: UDP-3-O-(3-hydroxymyristoyl)glucosamine N-acyltransferase [Rhodocyclaceae bacterium]|nr:UDP-3-O-(3-hydroxymyristoyl)glucosamine N-acyltransferase [Rhodocyclaceae bacterium]